jgi:hypothetical protein
MPWKLDENKHLAVDDKGNPIYVQDGDGKEKSVDYEAITKSLQESAKGEQRHRTEHAALKARMEPLKDVDDLAAYVKAHKDLEDENARLRDNQTATAKEIEEKVANATTRIEAAWGDKKKVWDAQMEVIQKAKADAEAEAARLKGQMNLETMRNMFNESTFIKDKCSMTPSILFALFKEQAKIEEGRFNGLIDGEPMLDTDGKPATLDAWLHKVINAHPDGKTMLKGSEHNNPNGIPNPGGGGGGNANPFLKDSFNMTEQNELWRKDPGLAQQMRAAAGVK